MVFRFRSVFMILFAVLLIMGAFSHEAGASSNAATKFVAAFEGGKLFMAGHIPLVELRGTFRQMGRQYGHLLSHKMKKLYHEGFELYLAGKKGAKRKDVLDMAETMFNSNPRYIREFYAGMAETSGLTLEEHKIVSGVVMGYIVSAGCSGLGVWGDYTENGKLVFGRNWDLPAKDLVSLAPYFNVVVFNPVGTSNSVADFSYAGMVFFQTSINDGGIFLELQNGQMCDPKTFERYTNSQLLSLMFDYSTLASVRAGLESIRSGSGIIMNVADADAAYSYEMATFDTKCRQDDAAGFIANSNHYIDPSWKGMPEFKTGEKYGCTLERRCNLFDRAKQWRGGFTPAKMMELFDTTIPNGGPTFPETGSLRTIYQVVVSPGELKVWLKLRGFSKKWQEIDLIPHFVK